MANVKTSMASAVAFFHPFLIVALGALSATQTATPVTAQSGTQVRAPISGLHTRTDYSFIPAKHTLNKYDMSRIGKRKIDQGMNFYSQEAEQALGEKLAAVVEQQSELINDSMVTEYVNRLEQTIARHADSNGPFTVKVVNDPDTNAYSLPGGFIYVYTGLILATENEAEFAAVLAHETGHLAARHMTKLITKQKTWKVLSLAAGGPAGYLFVRTALPVFVMNTMRKTEFEADLLGLEYQYASGYDPNEFVQLLNVLNDDDQEGSFWGRLTDSHPTTQSRIIRARTDIRRYLPSRSEYITDSSEFQQVKMRVANLMAVRDFGWKSVDSSTFAGDNFLPFPTVP
jgi:predicted Zn-dependent protease